MFWLAPCVNPPFLTFFCATGPDLSLKYESRIYSSRVTCRRLSSQSRKRNSSLFGDCGTKNPGLAKDQFGCLSTANSGLWCGPSAVSAASVPHCWTKPASVACSTVLVSSRNGEAAQRWGDILLDCLCSSLRRCKFCRSNQNNVTSSLLLTYKNQVISDQYKLATALASFPWLCEFGSLDIFVHWLINWSGPKSAQLSVWNHSAAPCLEHYLGRGTSKIAVPTSTDRRHAWINLVPQMAIKLKTTDWDRT